MDIPAFPAQHLNASAGNKQEPHCRKRSRILSVLTAIRRRLIGARDLIIDRAPLLAWHRADPDAADRARACSTSPSALDVCYRVHTLICRGHPLESQAAEEPLLFASYAGPGRNWANAVALNAFLVGSFCFFTSNALLSSFWSTLVRQASLTYTATIIVALAAQ
jgi:hypothetical protein